jgi:hypothetical protein
LVKILHNMKCVVCVRSVWTWYLSTTTNGRLNFCWQITNIKLQTRIWLFFFHFKNYKYDYGYSSTIPDNFNILGIYIVWIKHKMVPGSCVNINKPVKFPFKIQAENLTKFDIMKIDIVLPTDNTNAETLHFNDTTLWFWRRCLQLVLRFGCHRNYKLTFFLK